MNAGVAATGMRIISESHTGNYALNVPSIVLLSICGLLLLVILLGFISSKRDDDER